MAPLLWTQRQDIGPAARFGHALAFDSARGRTVLFGGRADASPFGDTWEWDGSDWTQMQDVGPPPMARAALAFDSTRQRTVLFGGMGAAVPFGDTWEWDGGDWTQVQDAGPSARSGHAMAFDSDQQCTLLFGGDGVDAPSGDTWQWDGNAWTQVEDVGPPPRALHGLGYAADRKRTVLFGGNGTNETLRDTWEWDGTHWTQMQDIGPPARAGAAMAFDGGSMAMFGGSTAVTSPATLLGDTWDWDGQHWTERQDMGPAARWLHAVTLDAARDRLVLFGGTATLAGEVQLGDTWEAPGHSGPPVAPGGVTLDSLDINRTGSTVSGLLHLTGPAPPDGVVVELSTTPHDSVHSIMDSLFQNGIPGPPWSVPISGGADLTSFSVFPVPIQLNTFVATLGNVTKTGTLPAHP